jgi:hypothetical protein
MAANRAIGSRAWKPCGVVLTRLFRGEQVKSVCRLDGVKMDGLYRTELQRLTKIPGLAKLLATFPRLAKFPRLGLAGGFSRQPANTTVTHLKPRFTWLAAAAVPIAGLGTWLLLSDHASNTAASEPVELATAVASEPEAEPAGEVSFNPASTSPEAPPVEGLKISSQSWRRGGFGSKALITFTLRNGNDYAVRDIEISCAFTRRDGSHLTDRRRMIHDIVNMKSRRTFARLHVGFVNINADKAKCALVSASRI